MHVHSDTDTGAGANGHRLFFGLWPSEGVREALARTADSVDGFRGAGRPVPAAKYHLTLHFLGGWAHRPDNVIDRAGTAAARTACRAFHLVVDHAGGFPGARVGWLAPSGSSGLDALWSELGHALDEAGVARRRHETFSPHVTVLRNVRERIAERPVAPVSWPVDDFVLVHSHSGRYDRVGRWPLAPA